MKSLPVVSLLVAALGSGALAVNFAFGITLFTTAGFVAIAALDYSRRPPVLSVARTTGLTRAQARSERLRLAA
jgi:hypothetical protein